jgi:hypothetical protein
VRQLLVFWYLHRCDLPRRIDFVLLFLDQVHELLDVLKWVRLVFLILPTACTVDMLMFLSRQVLDDSLKLRGKISLAAMKLDLLQLVGELLNLHVGDQVWVGRLISFLLVLLHLDEL